MWHRVQRRKWNSWVNPLGGAIPTASRAALTWGQQEGSGQYPVDWLVTDVSWTNPLGISRESSPAPRTLAPWASATCSVPRAERRRRESSVTTYVKVACLSDR